MANPLKTALRKKMKEILLNMASSSDLKKQTKGITRMVMSTETYKKAKRISVYLSTATEADTSELLADMFEQKKEVFVPRYSGDNMEMVKLNNLSEYEKFPLTKWNIKQPPLKEKRENALENGGVDIIIAPGVAFTTSGKRLGHGKGYYDSYFKNYFDTFPEKEGKTVVMGLALKEQIVADHELPMDEHDVKLDCVVTEDQVYYNS